MEAGQPSPAHSCPRDTLAVRAVVWPLTPCAKGSPPDAEIVGWEHVQNKVYYLGSVALSERGGLHCIGAVPVQGITAMNPRHLILLVTPLNSNSHVVLWHKPRLPVYR